MKALEEIKARAEKAAEARRNYGGESEDETVRLAFIAERSSYDVPPLIAALEAALSHAAAEIADYVERYRYMSEYDQMEAAGRANYAEELQQRIAEALA